MGSMLDALKNAGLGVAEDNTKAYMETAKDIKLPYYAVFDTDDKLRQDANKIEERKEKLDIVSLLGDHPFMMSGKGLYEWVRKNQDKCRLVDLGEYKEKTTKYYNPLEESRYERVLNYGGCCLGFYIVYSYYTRTMYLYLSHFLNHILDKPYREDFDALRRLETVAEENRHDFLEIPEDRALKIIDDLAAISLYVPFIVTEPDNVVYNTHKLKGLIGYRPAESLGYNILKSEKAMELLKDWIKQGGKINPRAWYFLKESADGFWYLRRKRDIKEE